MLRHTHRLIVAWLHACRDLLGCGSASNRCLHRRGARDKTPLSLKQRVPVCGFLDDVLKEKNVAAFCGQVTPQDKRGQAEGIRRQASDIVSLSAPIGLGVFADLLSAPGAVGFAAIAMAGTCAFLLRSVSRTSSAFGCVFALCTSGSCFNDAVCVLCACDVHSPQTVSSTARQSGFRKDCRAMQTVASPSETQSPEQLRNDCGLVRDCEC